MDSEKRAFFRLDVSIPVYKEPISTAQRCFHISKKTLIDRHGLQEIKRDNFELERLFKDDVHVQNGAVELFTGINEKLGLFAWLLDGIIEGVDLRTRDEYGKRLLRDHTQTMPRGHSKSKIMALLQGLYVRIDGLVLELINAVDCSVEGRVFRYEQASKAPFKVIDYVDNLSKLAAQGNWLAKVITLLVDKLNHYEQVFIKLKQAYKGMSDTTKWPVYRVNLAAGGLSFFIKESIQLEALYCLVLLLDEDYIFIEAECVTSVPQPSKLGVNRVAFNFNKISTEDEAHIVRYLIRHELDSRS